MTEHHSPLSRALIAALVLPPAAWFVHLNASYRLTFTACETGARWPILLLSLAALFATAAALAAARRERRAAHAGGGELGGGPGSGRQRFLTGLAVIGAVFFLLLIMAASVPALVVDPCR